MPLCACSLMDLMSSFWNLTLINLLAVEFLMNSVGPKDDPEEVDLILYSPDFVIVLVIL